jgi:hypothetical protein
MVYGGSVKILVSPGIVILGLIVGVSYWGIVMGVGAVVVVYFVGLI